MVQVALGLARYGWILNLVSAPVLAGFTQAATVLIVWSQLPSLLGLESGWMDLIDKPAVDGAATAFGLGSLAFLVITKRIAPQFPAVMVAVTGSGVISYYIGYAHMGGAVIGSLPSGLPSLFWPGLLPWEVFGALVVPALVIALVSFLETASSAKVESQLDRRPWNDNQDLIAQGLAKVASGLTGSFPTSSSFSRSAINLYAGAKTGWATVFTVAMVLVVLMWLTPALAHIPTAALAAVVVAAVSSLFKPSAIVGLWRVLSVEAAILGVMLSLIAFLHHHLHPRIIEVGIHPDGSLRDRHLWNLPPLAEHLYALRMDAELDFAAASSFERTVSAYLNLHPETRHVCLFAQPINRIDASGIEIFGTLQSNLALRNIILHVSGMKLPVERVLIRAGLLRDSAMLRLYRTDAQAIQNLRQIGTADYPAFDPHV
jgi:SulP family sulfate permease